MVLFTFRSNATAARNWYGAVLVKFQNRKLQVLVMFDHPHSPLLGINHHLFDQVPPGNLSFCAKTVPESTALAPRSEVAIRIHVKIARSLNIHILCQYNSMYIYI